MMVRNVASTIAAAISSPCRASCLVWVMPSGQKKVGQMAPGLDFASGMVGDRLYQKARNNDWLLCNDGIATPATTSRDG